MEIIREYIDTAKYLESLENELIDKLYDKIGLQQNHVKSVEVHTINNANTLNHKIIIKLIGINTFRSEDVAKIKGLAIITPNKIEIDGGMIYI